MGALLKILKILGAVVLGLVVLIVVAFATVQTRAGKDWLAGLATRALSRPGMAARVGTIEGTVPFDMRLSELRLPDADGEFLPPTNLPLAAQPPPLLPRPVQTSPPGA